MVVHVYCLHILVYKDNDNVVNWNLKTNNKKLDNFNDRY